MCACDGSFQFNLSHRREERQKEKIPFKDSINNKINKHFQLVAMAEVQRKGETDFIVHLSFGYLLPTYTKKPFVISFLHFYAVHVDLYRQNTDRYSLVT